MACLGAVYARSSAQESRDLFIAGTGLWIVTMEADNREARSIDMVTAVRNKFAAVQRATFWLTHQGMLLVTFGVTTSDKQIEKRAALLLCSLSTASPLNSSPPH